MGVADESEWLAPILRGGAFAIVAFQIGYTLLDSAQFPQSFARTLPFHIASMALGVLAIMSTLTPRAARHWQAVLVTICSLVLASSTSIAVIDGNSDVLVASIVLFFFGAGALVPWSPRCQAALVVAGTIAFLGYCIETGGSSSGLAIDGMRILSAALLSQLSAVYSTRYRVRLAEQVEALSKNHRLLSREMELHEHLSRARELEYKRRQESESMLSKVFEASPDNIAVNSLVDGRFIAVNDSYQVAGYTRGDVMGSSVIELGTWPNESELTRFIERIQQAGHVKNMEITQRRKDGTIETNLISASVVEVNGEACVISMTRDITEIKRTENRLRASHAALRKILQATLDTIVVRRVSDDVYIDFNHQFGMSGYTPRDINESHANLQKIFKDIKQQKALRAQVLAEGVVRNVEVELLTPDGRTTPTLLSAVRVDLDGEDCVVTMIRDLTAAKEASRKIEESAKAVQDIFDVSPDAISVSRVSDGKFVECNDELLHLTGYTREQLLSSSAMELELFANPKNRMLLAAALARDGVVRNLEIEFRTASQAIVPTLISASMIKLGNEPCVVAYTRDITARKRIEQDLMSAREEMSRHVKALSASEETFRKLFDANLDSMTLTGPDGTFTNVNRAFVQTTGYSREETIGHHFSDFNQWIHPDEMIAFAKGMNLNNQVRNVEVAFRNKDGTEHPTLLSATYLELDGQQCCLTVSRDIEDIKMTQRELVAAREAALAASRAKSEFLASMSHEIRTPMNAILGMADLLAESELDNEQRRYVKTVVSNGNALLELINGILDLAKVESGRISLEAVEFDPREVTQRVLEMLAIRAHEKGLELVTRFAPEVAATAIGDPLRLGQILINLIGNAIKFTPSGQVMVSIELDPNPGVVGGLKFVVTDTGIGIPADKLHLLFHAFTQADSSTSRKYGGSGLGLAIVSRLVALMHGKVEVASEFGKGSCFSFTAQFGIATTRPALSGPRERADEIPVSTSAPTVDRPLHILIADDSYDNRALIEAYLKKTPFRVEEAEDGQQAIDKFKTGRFDLVLMDIQMPVVDGYEATRKIRGWERENGRRRTPVVALTASALEDAADRSIAAGCDAHVTKPVKKSKLLEAIRDAVKDNPLADERTDVSDLKENICRTE